MSADRREFLGSMLAVGLVPGLAGAGGRRTGSEATRSVPLAQSPWDVSWADKLTGKHRAVFDNVEPGMGLGVLRALVWMNDNKEVYGTTPADTNAVVVLRHDAIWFIMDDEFWAHHKVGDDVKMTDPATKLPVARNPLLGANVIGLPPALADDSLRKTLASGTVLACNLAFNLQVVPRVKADMKLDDAKAREMALKHVIPGVILQPSGVFAVVRAQEAGCQYLLASDA